MLYIEGTRGLHKGLKQPQTAYLRGFTGVRLS
ncbi:TPA_asm: hypothetical protein [Porphyromonas phage phage014a_Kyudai4]|uniref:Uncharacterized protein n=2 Tax=Viruses TaxID=10239 RepID=A0AAT9JBD1_9CAUD